jgi:hypothetical protein
MSKYKNKKTIVDNIKFDSAKEARRYCSLKVLQQTGIITKLELQPRFDIYVEGKYCGFYKADFSYFRNKERVIEDVKGVRTPVFNLKKKLVEALYPIKITLV